MIDIRLARFALQELIVALNPPQAYNPILKCIREHSEMCNV